MQKKVRIIASAVSVVIITTFNIVAGQTPFGTAINYQGQLKEGGWPAHGTYDFTFALYDANEGGFQVGDTVFHDDVLVDKGLFSVLLDFGSGAFNGDARWVEIGVRPGEFEDPNEYTTLSPRQELTPTPYAIYATMAETVTTEDDPQVGTNTVNLLAKWDGFALVSSSVFDDGNSVGVGTTTPVAKLDVAGDIAVNGTVVINALGQWIGDPTGLQGPPGPEGPKGDKPAHQWSSTSLRFENPDGSWGSYIDLQGPQGPAGPGAPACAETDYLSPNDSDPFSATCQSGTFLLGASCRNRKYSPYEREVTIDGNTATCYGERYGDRNILTLICCYP